MLIAGLAVFGNANDVTTPAPPAVSGTEGAVPSEEPAYVFKGDRIRDPFLPLTGGAAVSMEMSAVRPEWGAFNPAGAELKGILKTPTGRWAILRTTDGAVYMVQNGKIYDPKRKAVDGFQGIVKERTLVILGPKNEEIELHLKKEEDAAKAKP